MAAGLASPSRGQRIDWIIATLINPEAELYQGWDKEKNRADPNRRVAVVYEELVVVIKMRKDAGSNLTATFVTAYLADNSLEKIRGMPVWDKNKMPLIRQADSAAETSVGSLHRVKNMANGTGPLTN